MGFWKKIFGGGDAPSESKAEPQVSEEKPVATEPAVEAKTEAAPAAPVEAEPVEEVASPAAEVDESSEEAKRALLLRQVRQSLR